MEQMDKKHSNTYDTFYRKYEKRRRKNNDDYLPSYEELSVPEITMTSAAMKAGAIYFGKYCDDYCKEFMLCRIEEKDPRVCLREGKAVTACGVEFFNKVKGSCAKSFTKYWKCLDNGGAQMEHKYCKKTQKIFSECLKEKIGLEPPELGHFAKVRVVKTTRPKPPADDVFRPRRTDFTTPLPKMLKKVEVKDNPLLDEAKKMGKYGTEVFC